MYAGKPFVGSVTAPARTFFGLGLERAVQRHRPSAQPSLGAGEGQVQSNTGQATAGAPTLRPEGCAATLPQEEAAVLLPYDGAMTLLVTASEVGESPSLGVSCGRCPPLRLNVCIPVLNMFVPLLTMIHAGFRHKQLLLTLAALCPACAYGLAW